MRTIFSVLLLSLASMAQSADLSGFFVKTDDFLKKYVKDGMVEYQAIKNNSSSINALYSEIGKMDLSGASEPEKKAFYINAYNLIVIYQVTKYYPLKSPLDQSGFFDKVKHSVAGESLTLNHLEIKKIILPYNDPRIHFVLACAAKSCPPLASFAFIPDKLDAQLEERTKLSINDGDWLKVDNKDKKAYISKIFEWYQKDFTKAGTSVLAFINRYRKTAIPDSYSIKYYEYDWGLNEG